ncbi:MAG: DNA-directed RNA polymerase subunit omega [Eubacteriales bacterium]|jgi:DNA-directed RNA polymerase subunit omega|nr:DNA-directed RNA polymerase subunit omega [Eubacteriales bacterium]
MLVNPPIEKLLPKTENRYTLAILVAKRARQLVDGALPLFPSESPNLVTVACEELGADRICCVQGQVTPYIPLRPEVEAARLAAKHAAAQADMADAVREELERTNAMLAEPADASDVQIISDMLLDEAVLENDNLELTEEQTDLETDDSDSTMDPAAGSEEDPDAAQLSSDPESTQEDDD